MTPVENKFSIIVPVLNSRGHIRACLDSILAAAGRYGNTELTVLDNGSDDGTYEILFDEYSHRARIEQVRGLPVSALRNRGAEMSDGEFLSFIDSDCIIAPDYFEKALHVLRTRADATGSQLVLPPDSTNWIERTWVSAQVTAKDGFVKFISAGNLVIKRAAFFAVGGFDGSMISCEDDDLGMRLNKAGFRVFEAHAVYAVHAAADETLRMFFFKSAWRSLGMFRLLSKNWLSKSFVDHVCSYLTEHRSHPGVVRRSSAAAWAHCGFSSPV